MTSLKDLPEGTLLISNNGRKGLYSNDNAPIFVMELGDTRAKVLWKGTSRYDNFMNPLIKKEHGEELKEDIDYILPENVGIMLPTQKPFEEHNESTDWTPAPEDKDMVSFGISTPSYSKFHVNLTTLLDDTPDNYGYLNVVPEEKDNLGWKTWCDSASIGDKVVMVADLNDYHGSYKVTFTKDEYEDIAAKANSSSKRNGLPILPKFDPDNPVFEFVEEGTKEEPKFKVELEPGEYLNFTSIYVNRDDSAEVSNGYIFPSTGSETSAFKTVFTLPEYNSIKEEIEKSTNNGFSHLYTLPTFSLEDDHFKIQGKDEISDVDEVKGTDDEHHKDAVRDGTEVTEPKFRVIVSPDVVSADSNSYLNLEKHTSYYKVMEPRSTNMLKLSDHAKLYMEDSSEEHFADADFITAFTLPEYKKIRKQALENPEYDNMHWVLPEYNPNDARFELVSGDSLPVDAPTKSTKTLPKSVRVDLKSLELYITDLPKHLDELKLVVDKLVDSLGELNYGYWLYVNVLKLQEVLNNSNEDAYKDICDGVHLIIDIAHKEL